MEQSKYKISVIIPTYNRLHELVLTLNSLCNQTLSLDQYEVIVCDDGSKTDTLSIVKRYEEKINIKYCYHPDKGFRVATTRNLGIKVAQGDVCVFIDNGILVSSKALENHYESHIHPKCAVVGYVYGFDDLNSHYDDVKDITDKNDVDVAIKKLQQLNIRDSREIVYEELGDEINGYPAPWVLCWSGNVSVKRSFLFDVGLFDESYSSWGGEDNDLALALYTNGAEFILNRNSSSIHYPHEKLHNIITNPKKAEEELLEKQEYLFKKYPLDTLKQWFSINELELNQYLVKKGDV